MKKGIFVTLIAIMLLLAIPGAAWAESGTGSGSVSGDAAITEQFNLKTGEVYYFDLSSMNLASEMGRFNEAVPDKSYHYVPFTYAGTVDAYKLTKETAETRTTAEYAAANKYLHSLFVSKYNLRRSVSWDNIYYRNFMFANDNFTCNDIPYTLRCMSGGSKKGMSPYTEWDAVIGKVPGIIQIDPVYKRNDLLSWVQDPEYSTYDKIVRLGTDTHTSALRTLGSGYYGFLPVLEVMNPEELGADALEPVTLDLNGGTFDGKTSVQIVTRNGSSFSAPAYDASAFVEPTNSILTGWSDGKKTYRPGDTVPAGTKALTAQWEKRPVHTHCSCGSEKQHDGHESITYTAWNGTTDIQFTDKKAYVYLTGDVKLSDYKNINVKKGNTLYICLNGHTIDSLSVDGTGKFIVTGNSHLVVSDCQEKGRIIGSHSGDKGGAVYLENSTMDLYGGNFIHRSRTGMRYGSAIGITKNSVLNIYGGELRGNHVSQNGGAVYVDSDCTLNLYGGTITDNSASSNGGGIYCRTGSKVSVHGGTVYGNGSSNLYLEPDVLLTIGKNLASDTLIGISTANTSYPAQFTDITDESAAKHFMADNKDALQVHYNAEGKYLELQEGKTEGYPILIQSSTGGTSKASAESAVKDTEISLTATPDKGYHFKEWKALNGEVTISENKFTMPDGPVILQAVFDPVVETPAMAATCTEAGNTAYWSCKNCGKYFDSADCTKEIQAGSWKLDTLGHDMPKEFQVETKASFTQDGNMVRKCTRCDEAITQAIPKITAKLSTTAYTYSGKTRTPSVICKGLTQGKDYTVSLPAGRKAVGKYTITIKGAGDNYTGSKTLTCVINPKGTGIKKPKAAKKAFTAKWSRQSTKMNNSRITGYQVQYSLKKNFKSAKTVTIKGYTKTSKKISKLKKKKTYYVRVRTYKKVGKTTFYSTWSKAKHVKTK